MIRFIRIIEIIDIITIQMMLRKDKRTYLNGFSSKGIIFKDKIQSYGISVNGCLF